MARTSPWIWIPSWSSFSLCQSSMHTSCPQVTMLCPYSLHACILSISHACIPTVSHACIPSISHACIPSVSHACIPSIHMSSFLMDDAAAACICTYDLCTCSCIPVHVHVQRSYIPMQAAAPHSQSLRFSLSWF